MKTGNTYNISRSLEQALSLLDSQKKVSNFLADLLTPQEIAEFSRRFQVAQMLDQNMSYKEIEQKTSMSSTTIARISKCLQQQTGYANAIALLKSVTDKHHTGHRS